MSRVRRVSFVVRVVQHRRGEVSGVIEQVATGAKEAFSGMEAIGLAIVGMLDSPAARAGATSPRGGPREVIEATRAGRSGRVRPPA